MQYDVVFQLILVQKKKAHESDSRNCGSSNSGTIMFWCGASSQNDVLKPEMNEKKLDLSSKSLT